MPLIELISAIGKKHDAYGFTINPPATEYEITEFERKLGCTLPDDFREFYSVCNGFSCLEDLFNMVCLTDALEYSQNFGESWFDFAEYMIYSDTWSVKILKGGRYELYNTAEDNLVVTDSLQEYLDRFLRGGVFQEGGLYDWHEELKSVRRNDANA